MPHTTAIRFVIGFVVMLALLAGCEAFPILPPSDPPGRPIVIEITNGGNRDAKITVSRPGNQATIVGLVEPDVVPLGTTVNVVAHVPWSGEWGIFADGAEYMGSHDVQEMTGAAPAELRFELTITGRQEGHWTRP